MRNEAVAYASAVVGVNNAAFYREVAAGRAPRHVQRVEPVQRNHVGGIFFGAAQVAGPYQRLAEGIYFQDHAILQAVVLGLENAVGGREISRAGAAGHVNIAGIIHHYFAARIVAIVTQQHPVAAFPVISHIYAVISRAGYDQRTDNAGAGGI